MTDIQDVFDEIKRERKYEDDLHGTIEENPHTPEEWMFIMRRELLESEAAFLDLDYDNFRQEILQVVSVGIACLEQHGVTERKFEPTP